MNVNFAVTTPASWASSELNARSKGIKNPNDWATRRKPWVRAISSAILGTDLDARKNYVLYTGTQDSFSNSYDSKYFRPKIGITSMEMDFKGTMGSTRSITLNFQCWTKDDLEVLEKLYMIPGMSIIVEWGWSLTSDGVEVSPVSSFLNDPTPDDYYLSNIMEKVIANRESYTGNYDGFVGLVTNFNYSLNSDLGFDCTIEIIGPGEMFLEESAINNSAKCKDINEKGKSKNNLEYQFNQLYLDGKEDAYIDKVNKEDKTKALVRQIWELETRKYDKDQRTTLGSIGGGIADFVNSTREQPEVYVSWGKFVRLFNGLLGKVKSTDAGDPKKATSPGSKSNNPKLALNYIPVSILPKFMSADPRVCIFKLHNIDKENGKARQKAIELPPPAEETPAPAESETPASNETTFEGVANAVIEWAAEKGKALLVKGMQTIRDMSESDITFLGYNIYDNRVEELYPNEPLPNIFSMKFAGEQIDIYGDKTDLQFKTEAETAGLSGSPYYNIGFLNCIFLNCAYIRDLLVTEDELNIEDVLSKLLSDLNECVGGIWDLQYTVSEQDPSKLCIYDASYTSINSRNPNNVQPYTFKIEDILPLSVTVESKLVDGFKEMVLYGNSKDNGTTNSTNTGNNLYSKDVKDGFKVDSKSIESCPPGSKSEKQLLQDAPSDLDAAYYLLTDAVDDESVGGAKTAIKQYIKYLETSKPQDAKLIPRNNNILLPFNFSVDIDGFSGLVWGNAINFNYLPSRYNGNIFFQVTKIKHSLNSDQWITTLETVMRLVNTDDTANSDDKKYNYADTKKIAKESVEEANKKFAVSESTQTEQGRQATYVRDKYKNETLKPMVSDAEFQKAWEKIKNKK